MATEAMADVARGWHVFCCGCVIYDTQFVEFLVFLCKYPVDFLDKNKIITLPVQPGAAEIPCQRL
jgi:hypothetical protein